MGGEGREGGEKGKREERGGGEKRGRRGKREREEGGEREGRGRREGGKREERGREEGGEGEGRGRRGGGKREERGRGVVSKKRWVWFEREENFLEPSPVQVVHISCGTIMTSGYSLVPRPSLSLASAITILEAGKKELVKREEGLVKLVT